MTVKKIFGIYAPGTKKVVADLTQMNLNTIFTAPKNTYVSNAKNAGMDVYVHYWTFKAPEISKRYGIKNIYGDKLLWSDSGCPNNPGIKNRSLEWIETDACYLDIEGIILDGIRFPSPANGLNAFLSCFCDYCNNTAREYALDLKEIRKGLKNILKDIDKFVFGILTPIDMLHHLVNHRAAFDWLIFRCKTIETHLRAVRQKIQDLGIDLILGVDLFTPSLALLVGQNYQKIATYVDLIQPMVYHSGKGPACINQELASLIQTLPSNREKHEILEALYGIFWHKDLNLPKELHLLQKSGLPLEIVSIEVNSALHLIQRTKTKLNPIVFIEEATDQELIKLIGFVKRHKTHGLSLFAYTTQLVDMKIDLGELM
ncbi:MAG: putative glycoside hydrolase, partial [Candidatus Heimdallarchaeota archaeon]